MVLPLSTPNPKSFYKAPNSIEFRFFKILVFKKDLLILTWISVYDFVDNVDFNVKFNLY